MSMGKRMKIAFATIDRNRSYTLAAAVALVKSNAKAKFDETVEIAVRTGLDPRQNDQTFRYMVETRNGTGRTMRVAVIAKGDKADEARAAGADLVGADDLADQIQAGKMDFDRLIATPDMMMIVGRLGKVLGPRGLMPNPKLGTVTPNVAEAVRAAKGGAIELRAEKAGIIHAGIGKASFTEQQLIENVRDVMDAIMKGKPAGAKGNYIQKISLSSTMGPGLKLDMASINEDAAA